MSLLLVVIAAAVVILCWNFIGTSKDPREPQVAASNIPFIGHIFGLMKYQADYLKSLR